MFHAGAFDTEADADQVMTVAGTLSQLFIRLDGQAGAGGTGKKWDFVVRKNGSDTSVGCSVVETARNCSDEENSVDFAAGDRIAIKSTPGAPNPAPRVMRWTARYAN
jgi:hypothetical protein